MCQFGVRKTITPLTDVTREATAFVRWGGREAKETLNARARVYCGFGQLPHAVPPRGTLIHQTMPALLYHRAFVV